MSESPAAVDTDEKGHVDIQRGSLNYAFRADGFGPGCTPNVPDGWKSDPNRDHPITSITGAKVEARGGAKPSLAGAIPAR